MAERKGKWYLPNGREFKLPIVKMRGVVPNMTVIEGDLLLGELGGARSRREAFAEGTDYMATVDGTKTTVQARPRLREAVAAEKRRKKRRRCGRAKP